MSSQDAMLWLYPVMSSYEDPVSAYSNTSTYFLNKIQCRNN